VADERESHGGIGGEAGRCYPIGAYGWDDVRDDGPIGGGALTVNVALTRPKVV